MEIIKDKFDAAEKILNKRESTKSVIENLKENSSLKDLCIEAWNYAHGSELEACIRIYFLFHVRPHKIKDVKYTDYIKKRLKSFKKIILQKETRPKNVQSQLSFFPAAL